MARVVIAMVALALAAVLAPSPFGNTHVMRAAPVVHATVAGAEEEPVRECRNGPEPRSWSTRSSPARHAGHVSRQAVGAARREASARVQPTIARGREEHLRSWSTPSALQVFRH
ncbi:hypothetical protein [Saccharothrix sp. ALI-22-I]|uniref:hypothetical protein n=1 Tax=Saccharothrix sp. ALI-22-I TaxID=1933778 RepID=UPI00117AA81F|nr:hypothetical protein [Saccharothrix sp. ALI-22-I]